MARPRKSDADKLTDFTVWLKPATLDAVCRYAHRHDESASVSIRRVLERVFAGWETTTTAQPCYGAQQHPSTLGRVLAPASAHQPAEAASPRSVAAS